MAAADSTVPILDSSSTVDAIDNVATTTGSGAVKRQRVAVAPSLDRKILDYDVRTDGNPVYVGFNFQSALVADGTWLIYKLFYDSSGRLVDQQVAERVAWTGRTSVAWRSSAGD